MTKTIDNFYRGRYSFLTNYYMYPIRFQDIVYPSTEHAYQAAKLEDRHEKFFVSTLETPGDAKKYCRRVVSFEYAKTVSDWDVIKDEVMSHVLCLKFAPNTIMADLLLETGDAILIEGNDWHDNYWGLCSCESCRSVPRNFNNKLGQLLMIIRSTLKDQDKNRVW